MIGLMVEVVLGVMVALVVNDLCDKVLQILVLTPCGDDGDGGEGGYGGDGSF